MRQGLCALLVILVVPTVGFAGDIQTDGKLKSTLSSGAPLEVASADMVLDLNADMVDGVHGTEIYTKAEADSLVAAAVDAEATARIAGDSSILAAQFFSDTVDLVNGEYDVVFGTIPGVGSFTASCFTNNGQIRFVSNMGSTNYYYAIGSQLRTGSSQWNIAGIPDILPVVIVGSTGEMLEFLVQENSGGGDCQFNVAGHALVQQ